MNGRVDLRPYLDLLPYPSGPLERPALRLEGELESEGPARDLRHQLASASQGTGGFQLLLELEAD